MFLVSTLSIELIDNDSTLFKKTTLSEYPTEVSSHELNSHTS